MSAEDSPLLKEFKTYLQSTLVAFGSDGALFSMVNQRFSEDWPGSPSLKEFAAQLGFGSKGVIKLLESIPDQVTIVISPVGEVILKPVPMDETRDNLSTIDATNKELRAERMRQQRYSRPQQSAMEVAEQMLAAQLAAASAQMAGAQKAGPQMASAQMAALVSGWPPPVPLHPLASVFNASRVSAAAGPVGHPPPPPPLKKINPNLIPLGPLRFPRCASTNNIADTGVRGPHAPTIAPMASQPPQPQRLVSSFHTARQPAVCNDFGDVVRVKQTQPTPLHQTKTTAANPSASMEQSVPPAPQPQEQKKKSPQKTVGNAKSQQQTSVDTAQPARMNYTQAMRYLERETWKKAEVRSDAYYEEDFRASASPRNGSPEPFQTKEDEPKPPEPKEEPVETKEQSTHEEASPPLVSDDSGPRLVPSEVKTEIVGEEDEGEDCSADGNVSDEYLEECDWDFLDGVFDHDDLLAEEDDNTDMECVAFLDQFGQKYNAPVSSDIYRLVHLFRCNGGSFSSMDTLSKAYLEAYSTSLGSKERNRLLGAPASTRIAKDSFSKAAYPGLFRVSERKSNAYSVSLLPCLAGKCVDPSVLWSSVDVDMLSIAPPSPPLAIMPSRPSTCEPPKESSLPTPSITQTAVIVQQPESVQAQQPEPVQQPNNVDTELLAHFSGRTMDSVLSDYADLLDSMREPALNPPFRVGQLVLFRHAKLGLCCGKIVRQDAIQHALVKHLDTQKAHYVKMDTIFAFPDELLKEHSTKSRRSCGKMAGHPGVQFFAVPVEQQQFRHFYE